MDPVQKAVAQEAAGALHESARQHKKASAFHRRAAQKDMEALDKLRKACEALGLKLSVGTEGGSHGQHDGSTPHRH